MEKLNPFLESFLLKTMLIDLRHGLSEFKRVMASVEMTNMSTELVKEMLKQRDDASRAIVIKDNNPKPILNSDFGKISPGSIVSVPLKGTMITEDGLCVKGIDHSCQQMEMAAANPNVKGIIIDTHSGGGEVTAAQRFANSIKIARQQKPVLQFINGMSASGAVFSGVESDEIMGGGNSIETGSIGVVIQLDKRMIDFVKEVSLSLYADQSKDKHHFMKALLDGDFDSIRQKHLNPIAKEFQSIVKGRRKGIDKSALTGHMYQAKEAKSLGLIDSIGTMQDAVARVHFLSRNRNRKARTKRSLENINFTT